MTSKQIYQEDAKRATLDHAHHNYMPPTFLLEDAKNKGLVYTIEEIDAYLEVTDQWDKRLDTLVLLIDYLDITNKLKRIILRNGTNIANT